MTRSRTCEEIPVVRKEPMPSIRPVGVLLLASLLLAPAVSTRAEIGEKAQMLLGNPDKAKADPSSPERFLIKRPQLALSYNDKLHFPNWVQWKLDAEDIGSEPRSAFAPDTSLPDGFTQIRPSDYTRSGYDRGHNCPSKDRSSTPEDNQAVFLMTNMTPQQHGLNAGPWERLEQYSRDLAGEGNSCYILAGHGFTSKDFKTIGKAEIAVPDFAWKIVVIEKKGVPISAASRVIAVRMPNISTVSKKGWEEFAVTPAELELATGLRFFGAFPAPIRKALLAKGNK